MKRRTIFRSRRFGWGKRAAGAWTLAFVCILLLGRRFYAIHPSVRNQADRPDAVGNEICPAGTVRLAGSTSMEEYVSGLAEVFMDRYPGVTVTVEYIGSSAGAEAVISGSAHIGNLSRKISEEEKREGLVENPVAVDGIVICVDGANTVTELTLQQLREIYTGRITSWNEVGGAELPVVTVGREAGSGTRDAFEELLGISGQCVYANEMDSAGAVLARVSRTPGAIGYLSLDGADDTIRIMALDGTVPDAESIRSGAYPLSRDYIMVTKGGISGQSKLIQDWFEFVYGKEGQEIAEMAGLVPIIKPEEK